MQTTIGAVRSVAWTILAALAAGVMAPGVLAPGVLASDWSTFRHDNERSGTTSDELELPLAPAWVWNSATRPRPAWGGPAKADFYTTSQVPLKSRLAFDRAFDVTIAGDGVYFGSSADDAVRRLDVLSGDVVWTYTADSAVRFAPSVAGGKVYFGAEDGTVYCVDAANGDLVWKYVAAGEDNYLVPSDGRFVSPWPIRSGVIALDDNVYFSAGFFPAEGVYVCALDARTGSDTGAGHYRRLRRDDISLQGYMLASSSRLFFPAGRSAPYIFARSSGSYVGQVTAGRSGARGTFALIAADRLFTGPSSRGGAEIEEFSFQTATDSIATYDGGNSMVVTANRSYLLSDTALTALERSSRSILWRRDVRFPYQVILAGGTLFAGGDGTVAAFRASDGEELWSEAVAGKAYGLAVANQTLFVSTDRGFVYAFGELLAGEGAPFVRGDANRDGSVDIADAVRILVHLFAGATISCEDHADVDDSGGVNVTDAVALLGYLFRAGASPAAPFPTRGLDPSADAYSCGDPQ